ncbi:MAG: hypothetical protein NC826_00915 [Candidatus Omnitrophica bacterium]|nr:hypothetical protein [Candidatus Omnitrophota bacterium]
MVNKKYLLYLFLGFIILFDIGMVSIFFTNRAFSHLALWRIEDLSNKEYFNFSPDRKPYYFQFENVDNPEIFLGKIKNPFSSDDDVWLNVIHIAKHTKKQCDVSIDKKNNSVKWGSAEYIFKQITEEEKRGVDCFNCCILLGGYLAAMGIKSRIWALEGRLFDKPAHSIIEVYIEPLKKWILLDVSFGFYATYDDSLLSLLELRNLLLKRDNGRLKFIYILDEPSNKDKILKLYRSLITTVILRTNNNYTDRYKKRYGCLNFLKDYIDSFPDYFRRGIDYFFGSKDLFIHYIDEFSPPLRIKGVFAHIILHFALLSLLFIVMIFLFNILVNRKFLIQC